MDQAQIVERLAALEDEVARLRAALKNCPAGHERGFLRSEALRERQSVARRRLRAT